jgi:hypothetical protein
MILSYTIDLFMRHDLAEQSEQRIFPFSVATLGEPEEREPQIGANVTKSGYCRKRQQPAFAD